jgi:hypothetical protein
MSVINSLPDNEATRRLQACRTQVEADLLKIVSNATANGWDPTEVAMALADAADDLVLHIVKSRKAGLPVFRGKAV